MADTFWKTGDVLEGLMPYVGGASMIGQLKNANAGQDYLMGLLKNNHLKDDTYETLNSAMKAQKGQAIAGGAIAGIQGAMSIAQTGEQLASLQDQSAFYNQLDEMSDIGTHKYNSYADIQNDLSRIGGVQANTSDDIRGMSVGQRVSNYGSAALSGANAGATIGGPWGAAVGAAVGLGYSGLKDWSGKIKADVEEDLQKGQVQRANNLAKINVTAATEQMNDAAHRQGAANAMSDGGEIKNYIASKRQTPKQKSIDGNNNIIRQHCNGGTLIRRRVK